MRPQELELLLATARVLRARIKDSESGVIVNGADDLAALDEALRPFNSLDVKAAPADNGKVHLSSGSVWARGPGVTPTVAAPRPMPFVIAQEGPCKWAAYPGWRFVPAGQDAMRHEKIPDGEGEKWVDIPRSQLITLKNTAIESCANALEKEALINRRVAVDPSDNIEVRVQAHRAAEIRNACADMLRTLKEI